MYTDVLVGVATPTQLSCRGHTHGSLEIPEETTVQSERSPAGAYLVLADANGTFNSSIEGMCVFRSVPIMSRGLGWRIHESVEDTKLSTNKQHSLSHTATRSGKLTRRSVSASARP